MNTVLAAVLLLSLIGVVVSLLERTHHRTATLPRPPFGAGVDHDLDRVLHDLAASGAQSPSTHGDGLVKTWLTRPPSRIGSSKAITAWPLRPSIRNR